MGAFSDRNLEMCIHIRSLLFSATLVAVIAGGDVRGQFMPGHVFVSGGSANLCKDTSERDFIWDVNPETGDISLFVEIPGKLCDAVTGLAFTPDGRRLRALSLLRGVVE